jgi:hypothetical protein
MHRADLVPDPRPAGGRQRHRDQIRSDSRVRELGSAIEVEEVVVRLVVDRDGERARSREASPSTLL